MKLNKFKTFGIACLAIIATYACSKKSDPEPDKPESGFDRKAMLTYLADDIIIPSYINFKTKLDLMLVKSDAFTSAPGTTTLSDFRAAWTNAYIEWQKIELIDIGPSNAQSMRSFFNIYPTNVDNINTGIADGNTNFNLPATISQQGFPAIDYLINGQGTDTQTVAQYTSATDAAKRIAYLKKVTTQMNAILTNVYTPWISGTYKAEFIAKSGTDAGSSLGVFVNGFVLNYERFIRSGKIGIPSGAMMNGVVAAEKVEAFYKKDISLILAKTAQQATIDFFNGKSIKTGTEGPSFKTYLDALGAKDSKTGALLSSTINTQFSNTNLVLNLLSNNLFSEINTNKQKVVDVYTQMQKSVALLKVDMTSAMSITITYTDNDGD